MKHPLGATRATVTVPPLAPTGRNSLGLDGGGDMDGARHRRRGTVESESRRENENCHSL